MGKKNLALVQVLSYTVEKLQQCEKDLALLQSIATFDWREVPWVNEDGEHNFSIEFTITRNAIINIGKMLIDERDEKIVEGNFITYARYYTARAYGVVIMVFDKYMIISKTTIKPTYNELYSNYILTRERGDELIAFIDSKLRA